MKRLHKRLTRIWHEPTPDEQMSVWSLCWLGYGVFCWYTGTPIFK